MKSEILKRIADGNQVVVGVNQFIFDEGNQVLRETQPKFLDRSVFEDEIKPLWPYRLDEGFEER